MYIDIFTLLLYGLKNSIQVGNLNANRNQADNLNVNMARRRLKC